jgi:uncharacterized membrane protein
MTPKLPGFLMGIGLGGFIDGILLHQVFQWHHMLTGENGNEPLDTVAGLEANTLVDGFFHLATWLCVIAAMILTIRAWQAGRLAPPWRAHMGMLLAGWGAFNLVEGLIDHQLFGLHHVRDDLGGPLAWDLAFLASGALLVAAGLLLERGADEPSDRERAYLRRPLDDSLATPTDGTPPAGLAGRQAPSGVAGRGAHGAPHDRR